MFEGEQFHMLESNRVSMRSWRRQKKDCGMLYFEMFTAIRLGLLLTVTRFMLLHKSKILIII